MSQRHPCRIHCQRRRRWCDVHHCCRTDRPTSPHREGGQRLARAEPRVNTRLSWPCTGVRRLLCDARRPSRRRVPPEESSRRVVSQITLGTPPTTTVVRSSDDGGSVRHRRRRASRAGPHRVGERAEQGFVRSRGDHLQPAHRTVGVRVGRAHLCRAHLCRAATTVAANQLVEVARPPSRRFRCGCSTPRRVAVRPAASSTTSPGRASHRRPTRPTPTTASTRTRTSTASDRSVSDRPVAPRTAAVWVAVPCAELVDDGRPGTVVDLALGRQFSSREQTQGPTGRPRVLRSTDTSGRTGGATTGADPSLVRAVHSGAC